MTSPLFIRADASVSIGTGHVMRMIALGQAWQEQGGTVHFICAEITIALEQRLDSEGFHLTRIHTALGGREDLAETLRMVADAPGVGGRSMRVVLDGYHFGAEYQLGVKEAGHRLLVVDDYGHADYYHADWVLNQNISAREGLYERRSPSTQLLLGPKFAMLRKEFLAYQGWKREIAPVARKILVTLGGSDPENVTLKVIEALLDLDVHAKVVIGGSNPHLGEIEKFIESRRDVRAVVEIVVNSTQMPELMAWADISIAAAGSTSLELSFMKLPSFLFILAENQIKIARDLERGGFMTCLGDVRNFNSKRVFKAMLVCLGDMNQRARSSLLGRQIVDGLGTHRLIEETGAFNVDV
jgi:UDP-2,4-diacetamido-2,4,6-trideoxy-beta-L-altropyranose hydrolase